MTSIDPANRGEWRLGGRALLGASLGLAFGSGMHTATASLFVSPLHDALGWSRTQISSAQAIGHLGSLSGPIVGLMVNWLGLRRVALGSTVLICLVYAGLSQMNGSLAVFAALSVLLTIGTSGTSGLVYGRVVTTWFVRARGAALACSRVGPAIVGSIVPVLLYRIIEGESWRAGYMALTIIIAACGVPVILWLVREPAPSTPAPLTQDPGQDPQDKVTIVSLLRDPALWRLLVIAFFLSVPLLGLTYHLHPLLTSNGMSGEGAAEVVGMFSAALLFGTFVSGILMDRYGPQIVGAIFVAFAITGFVALATIAKGPAGATGAVLLIGLNQGVENDLFCFIIARQFGRAGFSPVYGLMIVAIAVAASLGAATFGFLRDVFGSYDPALWLSSVSLSAAVAALFAGRRAERRKGKPSRPASAYVPN